MCSVFIDCTMCDVYGTRTYVNVLYTATGYDTNTLRVDCTRHPANCTLLEEIKAATYLVGPQEMNSLKISRKKLGNSYTGREINALHYGLLACQHCHLLRLYHTLYLMQTRTQKINICAELRSTQTDVTTCNATNSFFLHGNLYAVPCSLTVRTMCDVRYTYVNVIYTATGYDTNTLRVDCTRHPANCTLLEEIKAATYLVGPQEMNSLKISRKKLGNSYTGK